MPIVINQDHTVHEMATLIWEQFEIGQSCAVIGWVDHYGKLRHKGECVLELITGFDKRDNGWHKTSGWRRKAKPFIGQVIGGPRAQKCFQWSKVMIDGNNPKYTIWRLQ